MKKFKWINRPAAIYKAAEDGVEHGYTAEEAAKIFLIAPSGRYVKRPDDISERQLKLFIIEVKREMERLKWIDEGMQEKKPEWII